MSTLHQVVIWLLIIVLVLGSPVAASGVQPVVDGAPGTDTHGVGTVDGAKHTQRGLATTELQSTARSGGTASVSFALGSVNRDDNGEAALGGVVATIQDYAGAASVQIIYHLPEQGVTLYESSRFDVGAVKQAGSLGPRQQDPDRKADQLMASHIEENAFSENEEFPPQENEHVVVRFFAANGTLVDEITYVVGNGKRHTFGERTGDYDAQNADGDAAPRTRSRGFFSNSGNEPVFLSNVTNLTVLGFLLSVAGIVHQMLEGR